MTEAADSYRVRAVESDDVELIAALDAQHAARLGIEPLHGRGSASFHSRTGHSFVAESAGQPLGFVLASAIWTGGRPTLRMERLALADAAGGKVAHALLAALVKSAYDAGVYDLLAELPAVDAVGREALQASDFKEAEAVLYARTLGSRGQAGAR